METVPSLSAAGVTDFRISMRLPPDPSEALDRLSGVVGAFRTASDRPSITLGHRGQATHDADSSPS